jgi:DNA-binding CsgD family transcriptional regulator
MEEAYVRSIHGDHRAARRSAELLMSVADETGDTTALARALTLLGFVNAFTRWGEAEAPLQRAAELERQGAQLPLYHSPRTYLGLRRLWADELDDARVYLGEQHRRAVEHGDEDTRAALLVHLTQLEVRAGNWRTARRHSREALEIAEQAGLAQTGGIRYASALVDAHEGRTDAARRRGERALSECEAVGDRLFQVQSRLVLGFLELSLGNHGAAVAYFAPLRGMLQQIEVGDPGMHPYRADEVEALIGSGELAQAEERLSELERLGREFNRPRLLATGARCRGQLLAVGGALPAALASVDRALVEHERLPVPFERARTLLVFGQVRRRAKQKRASRESLEQALSTFEELGARLWAAKAHEELARIGGRVRAGELTGTERQVAELVARGLTNREAAAELFVSVRAVEANLSRIYAKLGVRSRTELARRLASRK